MRFVRSAFGLALMLLGSTGAAVSLRLDGPTTTDAGRGRGEGPASVPGQGASSRTKPERVANGDWADHLLSESFWRQFGSPQANRSEPTPARERSGSRSDLTRRSTAGRRSKFKYLDGGGSYRTVCVRLCDGYFWPISFATGHAQLRHDQKKCEDSCESPARLYVTRDAETPLEDMRDDSGRSYKDLKTAFVYRASYLASCKCRAHPWEAEAQARHARYALEAKSSHRQRH